MNLADLLEIRPGVTAVIGGGGKTTLLRTLGEELAGMGYPVLLCTTTKIFPFQDLPCARSLEELDRLWEKACLLCAGAEVPGTGKLTALDVPMSELTARFQYVLVEADGSAQHPLKAHATHEPVIPAEAGQIVCMVGASGFGKPIREAVHRPELYARLADCAVSDIATPERTAAVLRAEKFYDRILVNQAEQERELASARTLAALLDCPVLAGSLQRREYFVCSL